MGNVIMFGSCDSECNAKQVNPDFVGPHALAKAQRTLADSRDGNQEGRLELYNQGTAGVWGCTRCYFCNAVCPMELAPMDQIGKMKQEILASKSDDSSRPMRPRNDLVELVKAGGWFAEVNLGHSVGGNYWRVLPGLLMIDAFGFM